MTGRTTKQKGAGKGTAAVDDGAPGESRFYKVRHVTTYSYAAPVLLAHHYAHLTPRAFAQQSCQRVMLRVTPGPAELNERGVDYYGNPVAFFALRELHSTLSVQAASRVEVRKRLIPEEDSTLPWRDDLDVLAHLNGDQAASVADFLFDSPFVAVTEPLRDYARKSFKPGRPILACLTDLNRRINREFTYDTKATTLSTPLSEVFALRRGVCQDFAHLAIACLRAIGLPTRYVSGYLLTQPPPGRPRLRGADASHAWISVFVPEAGWIDLDPTNACLPDLEHVTLAWGRDYNDVSPLRGVVLGGGEHSLKVGVDVEPVEMPGRQP